ncbi:dihydrodipicolinate synthase family protein [Nocardia sp. CDC160]|uniref:dihydrodipicolinate synthase family protein n=1 Tax=Nocardia sp. CDC160 TaxID=3112166 RepID=UPI002DB8A460|nr:dihydrodipicolinate synthase family protein [Nocardia sp. CDC160]MEC3917442.1 dihydrodipicolinate synthase family protein [Nocardia sp. CDC160]
MSDSIATPASRPWHGVLVATTLPFARDYTVDHDAFGEHVAWLAANGCHGVSPNGSLGEYQTLTDTERAEVVATAIAAAPPGFTVMPGVAAYGALQAARLSEQAARAGAHAVMLLPPNTYRGGRDCILDHYRTVAQVGLPIVAYNNPVDTHIDLTPDLLAELHTEGLIVGVKEFTGDVRRIYEIKELAPDLDVLIGSDDVVLELGIAGAVGWISGYANAIPRSAVALYDAALNRDLDKALPLYRELHRLLRWDSRTEFVQAIKRSMDLAGRHGGGCRPPRLPLTPDLLARVDADTRAVLALGHH